MLALDRMLPDLPSVWQVSLVAGAAIPTLQPVARFSNSVDSSKLVAVSTQVLHAAHKNSLTEMLLCTQALL